MVAAVLVLAVVAAADGLRQGSADRAGAREDAPPPGEPLLRGEVGEFAAVGTLTRTRVLRDGREVLSEEEIDEAFPAPLGGIPFDIAHVAVAPDRTLVLAVYKFPAVGPARAGIELWRGRELVGAFTVPPGSFGGGLGFSEDGRLVATYERDKRQATLYDRAGRWEAYVPVG